jgi:uncharacterized membrane protein
MANDMDCMLYNNKKFCFINKEKEKELFFLAVMGFGFRPLLLSKCFTTQVTSTSALVFCLFVFSFLK